MIIIQLKISFTSHEIKLVSHKCPSRNCIELVQSMLNYVSSADESHSAGWKLQLLIYFHCDLSTPAMSIDSSQVGVALFPFL